MLQQETTVIAANRFGLGARPGELRSIGGDGREWLRSQLEGTPPAILDAQLVPSADTLARAQALARDIQAARKSGDLERLDTVKKLPELLRPVYVAEATARLRQAVSTDRPFLERLTQFWSNHFAVSTDKQFLAGLAGAFEREAIRPRTLGNFGDLLLAAETHPAMLLYLDNHLSVGPHSELALRAERRRAPRRLGINENLGREILELHTLGVGGGYTQADVTSFAQVLTGWSIGGGNGPFAGGEPGRFRFRPELHEPGAKVLLGRRYPDRGYGQGVAVLGDLARHPATARHIAAKLACHFIADNPPPAAVERLAQAFGASGGDLPTVYRALIEEREAWAEPLAKFKTPSDYIVSTYRGLAIPAEAGRAPLAPFELLGQRTWTPGSPAGWPDRGADWDGASALLKRIEWADAVAGRLGGRLYATQLAPELLGANLSEATGSALAHAASPAQALTLLLAAPEFMRR
ncbi:MAG TPA: DUF1800 domain-containing protein [Steroidobacteraceae bacterium]|jgi:uncharacterized protein (DUF1800 family)|nr:DUF1800 domain-containing protein [Steroidobacteraceae bacterium]